MSSALEVRVREMAVQLARDLDYWRGSPAFNAAHHIEQALLLAMREQAQREWLPIETAPFEMDPPTGRWLKRCLLASKTEFQWEYWVGQMDAEMWLGRDEHGACWDCVTPTHWMPFPPLDDEAIRAEAGL